jgi:hypothetical protein
MSGRLAEDLLLLCWHDERGNAHPACSSALPAGIGGALVLDALLAGTLELVDGRVTVTGDAPKDPLLAEVVTAVQGARRPPTMQKLIQRMGTSGRVNAVAERLAAAGVLRADERKVLWLFPVRRYPVADAGAVDEVRAQVRSLLAGEREPSPDDAHDTLLAALAEPTGATRVLFDDRSGRRDAERRAKSFGEGHGVPTAVSKVVQEAQAAALAAVAAAAAASSASSSSSSS